MSGGAAVMCGVLFVFPLAVSFVDISPCFFFFYRFVVRLLFFLSVSLSTHHIASERQISLECGVELAFFSDALIRL